MGRRRGDVQVKEEVVGVGGLEVEVEVDEVRVAGGGQGGQQGDFSFEKFGVVQRLLGDHLHGQLDGGGGGGGRLKVCHLKDRRVGTAEGGGKEKNVQSGTDFQGKGQSWKNRKKRRRKGGN